MADDQSIPSAADMDALEGRYRKNNAAGRPTPLDGTILGWLRALAAVAEQHKQWHRTGGRKGGVARAAVLSPERRREIASLGARTRWGKAKAGRPAGGTSHDE